MRGKTKSKKIEGFYRGIVAANVAALMAIHYKESDNQPLALAKATGDTGKGGLSKSTVQRVLAGSHGVNLETLEALATALSVLPYQLLIPQLDAANPPIVKGATEAERKLYREWRVAGSTGR